MKEPKTNTMQPRPARHRSRVFCAFVPPFAALSVSVLFGALIQPYAWILFYPAVFLSSWIGGPRTGLIATGLSTLLVLGVVIPHGQSYFTMQSTYFPAMVFLMTGALFGAFHNRLRNANVRIGDTLARSEQTNESLQRVLKERRLFAALIENSSDFIGIADPSGKPVYVNPAGRRMVGLALDFPVEKMQITEFYPPAQRAFATDVIGKSMAEKGQWQGETYLRNWQTGEAIPVSDTHFMIHDPETDKIIGMGMVARDVRERKILEAALLASHDVLVRAQEVAHVGSWRLNVVHNVLEWSNEAYRIFGVALGTPMNYEAFLACVHPADRSDVDRAWNAGLRGEVYDIEHRIVVDGAVRWVREKAELEFDENDVLIGGVGTTLDITDRKLRESELQKSQERIELALRGADLALWDWNVASGDVVFNPRWAELRGYRLDEIRGHVDTWIADVHPEDWPGVQQALEDYFQGRRLAYETEHRVRTKSGDWIWVLDRGKVFARNERGEPIRMAGTELDITLRKKSEEEQKRIEREQRFLAQIGEIFASSLKPAETLNRIASESVVFMANFVIIDLVEPSGMRRAKVAHADPTKAAVAHALERLPPGEYQPPILSEVVTAKETRVLKVTPSVRIAQVPDVQARKLLEAMQPQSAMFVPLIVRGEVIGIMSFISSTRDYQSSDVRLAEEVARRAALALENVRLHQTAHEAIKAREAIMGIVAHDLRNPLTTILLQTSLARLSGERADLIERAAKHMNRLIQDLFDLTSIDSGCLSMELDRLRPSEVVTDALETQRSLAASASLELRTELAPDLPDVWADRDRLLQVFENLVGNALKFTGPGGRITVGAASRDGAALFWVTDTGSGIPAEALPHVFDRFWQARRAKRGAGLGLSIVKGIVEAHGGHVWVESKPEQGTTFFFSIPEAPEADDRLDRPAPYAPALQ